MSNEADTCRKWVLPKQVEAGWDNEPHRINEQVTFTDGRIVLAGNKVKRRPQKRADYTGSLRNEASTSMNWPIQSDSRKPTLLTFSVILPSMPRCGPAASGRNV